MTNKRLIPDYVPLFLFTGKNCQNCLFTHIQICDIDIGQFVAFSRNERTHPNFVCRREKPRFFGLQFGRPYKFFQGLSDSFLCPVDPKARLGHHSLVKACKWPRLSRDGDRCWGNVYLLKIENCGQIFRKWKSGHL